MPKIILLNGPARSGKDFAAAHLMDATKDDDPVHLKLSTPLKIMAGEILAESCEDLEKIKDRTLDFGASYRDVQIMLFESIAQTFTRSWLGQAMTRKIKKLDVNIIVISDVGRDEEIEPLIKAFGAKNILVVQIFRDGCSFDNDIRYYITDARVKRVTVYNDNTHNFKTKLDAYVLDFLS
jgi:hypothetical protein